MNHQLCFSPDLLKRLQKPVSAFAAVSAAEIGAVEKDQGVIVRWFFVGLGVEHINIRAPGNIKSSGHILKYAVMALGVAEQKIIFFKFRNRVLPVIINIGAYN